MRKIKKVIILLCLVIVLVFGVAGCNASTAGLQSKIDDLQSQLEEMEDRLAEMDDQIRERDAKIEELEKDLAVKAPEGTLYTLQEAYNNGFLNISAIMHISYYMTGSVHDNNGDTLDFVPNQALSDLSENIVEDIKTAYFNTFPKGFQNSDGSYRHGKEILNVKYFGEYNSHYVVIVDSDFWSYGDVVEYINIDGIVLAMSGAPVLVFSYDK